MLLYNLCYFFLYHGIGLPEIKKKKKKKKQVSSKITGIFLVSREMYSSVTVCLFWAAISGVIGLAAISHRLLRRREMYSSVTVCLFCAAISGVIGLAAISHRLLRRDLTSSESHINKPQSPDKNQNKSGCTEQEAMMFNPDGNEEKRMLESYCYERRPIVTAGRCNSNAFDALETLKNVMDALADPTNALIGVYGSQDEIKDTLLERVNRRILRDHLFDLVITTTVTRKPNVRKIQEDIARQLGLTLHPKSKDERANQLIQRIKNERKILIILRDLRKGFNLGKVGIPYGADHTGCKILLTSTSQDVLSEGMHTHINFMV